MRTAWPSPCQLPDASTSPPLALVRPISTRHHPPSPKPGRLPYQVLRLPVLQRHGVPEHGGENCLRLPSIGYLLQNWEQIKLPTTKWTASQLTELFPFSTAWRKMFMFYFRKCWHLLSTYCVLAAGLGAGNTKRNKTQSWPLVSVASLRFVLRAQTSSGHRKVDLHVALFMCPKAVSNSGWSEFLSFGYKT